MKRGQQINYLLPFVFILKSIKSKPAGRVPPGAILLSGNKSMQKSLLLAEGISSAGFPRHPITAELNKPARYRGASLSV